ncbi:globin [Gammaproteobacteria bacterium AB-CW1]|uniref:Globin n=1 Tax=Natronospira elongata TaxID=3110268 RepID=A0AAP6MLB3_9GAMM|nr:globin [Gammaproteobacteria bacterium AB-CW1]
MDQFGDVQQSFGRCLRENPDFVADFYQRLLASNERFPAMFAHTDWPKQNKLIRRGISMVITYAGSPGVARRQIEDIAKVHSRKGHAPVEPHMYDHWIESLLLTVQNSDPRYDTTLGKRWREALIPAIDFMRGSY